MGGTTPLYPTPIRTHRGRGLLVLYMREQFFKKFQEKILEILNWGFLFLLQMAIKNFRKKFLQFFN